MPRVSILTAICILGVLIPARPAVGQPGPSRPGVSPLLDRIAQALSGTWEIVDSPVAAPGAPAAEPRRGVEVWALDRGGLTLTETYHAGTPRRMDDETAMLWWDGKAHGLRGLWCADINDEGCNGFEAHMEGDTIVMSGEWEFRGKRNAWRESFVREGSDAFAQVLFLGPPGGELAPATHIHAVRARRK